jgi:hypothetical protein
MKLVWGDSRDTNVAIEQTALKRVKPILWVLFHLEFRSRPMKLHLFFSGHFEEFSTRYELGIFFKPFGNFLVKVQKTRYIENLLGLDLVKLAFVPFLL